MKPKVTSDGRISGMALEIVDKTPHNLLSYLPCQLDTCIEMCLFKDILECTFYILLGGGGGGGQTLSAVKLNFWARNS